MSASDFIKKSYSSNPKPLYLSKLGTILKQYGHEVGNLREFIELMDDFTVACGPEKERTAIASIADKEEVEALLKKDAEKIDTESFQFLSK